MERSMRDVYAGIYDILTNPKHLNWICPALLLMEAALCGLIIRTVAYTEIDWVAYMQQVQQFINGERDYPMIKGDTGPLVYPAIHVYIYRGLYEITQQGQNILLAQIYFSILYIFNLGLAMLCYMEAKAPPYLMPMLVLSKRLHSIYLLRCFNDCFAVTGLFLAIYLYQKRQWTWGSLAFSFGLGVKMNLLLVLPAIGVILFQAIGPREAIFQGSNMLQVQVLPAIPFLRANARGYLASAFDLSREFKYKWTVNWRFLSEKTFLSKEFALGLLILHASLLVLFISTRWNQPSRRSLPEFFQMLYVAPPEAERKAMAERVTPHFILTSVLTANAIGMLCARTLHYQFFSWIAWATPWLLYVSDLPPLVMYVVWLGQEIAWNQYPATDLSSKIVVGVLAALVIRVWAKTDEAEEDKERVRMGRAVEQAAREQRARLAGRSSASVNGKAN